MRKRKKSTIIIYILKHSAQNKPLLRKGWKLYSEADAIMVGLHNEWEKLCKAQAQRNHH
jgi:hypothetical protein